MESATAEAMAAGLIPVVHKSGGPWTDIVEFGNYGFGFSSPDEAGSVIQSLTHLSEGELRDIRKRIMERAKIFSYMMFFKCFNTIIDNLVSLIHN
jgi:alpha-1,2-mannosyltransferase